MTLALTLLLFGCAWIAAHAARLDSFPARLLAAGTVTAAAIVGVETFAGATGLLRAGIVAGGAAVVAAGILTGALAAGGWKLPASLRDDLASAREGLLQLRRPEIAALAAVAVVGWSWILAAIRYLPPRSVDDLGHHLPPIFEAAARGSFVILPLDLRPWFSYPLNADLLFLWPALLRGDIRWVDGAQAATALLAAVAIVALARQAGASRRSALLCALAFLLLPVTVRQASSCYTDLSIAAFYGAAVWGTLAFERTGARAPLFIVGLASGLLAGTKYNFLLPIAALTAVLVLVARRAANRRAAWAGLALLFAAPAALLSGYWFLRNAVQLGNPVYPYPLGLGPLKLPTALSADDPAIAFGSILRNIPRHPWVPLEVAFSDLGAGGLDGGFGPLFWGIVLPVGLWQAARGARVLMTGPGREPGRVRTGGLLALLFAAALTPYLSSPFAWYDVLARHLLASAVVGAAVAALALDRMKPDWKGLWAGFCGFVILCSALSLPLLAGTKDLLQLKQKMAFGAAARAPRFSSPWRSISGASHGVGRFDRGWELLDLVSDPPGRSLRPLWIYATGAYTAGFYGTRLQNRVWNFAPADERPAEPDVWFYYLTIKRETERIAYFGQPVFHYADVALRPDQYDCILATPETLLYVRSDRLRSDADLRERLASFYEQAYPEELVTASTLTPHPAGGTILTAGPVGLGLKALELRGQIASRVLLARGDDLDALARAALREGPVYFTSSKPQSGARPVATMKGTANEIGLYELGLANLRQEPEEPPKASDVEEPTGAPGTAVPLAPSSPPSGGSGS